jgi:hypothetical protein
MSGVAANGGEEVGLDVAGEEFVAYDLEKRWRALGTIVVVQTKLHDELVLFGAPLQTFAR